MENNHAKTWNRPDRSEEIPKDTSESLYVNQARSLGEISTIHERDCSEGDRSEETPSVTIKQPGNTKPRLKKTEMLSRKKPIKTANLLKLQRLKYKLRTYCGSKTQEKMRKVNSKTTLPAIAMTATDTKSAMEAKCLSKKVS